MKRSEMIKFVLDRVCGSWELNEDRVNNIIILMEQAGMKPPYNKEISMEEYITTYEWEPE